LPNLLHPRSVPDDHELVEFPGNSDLRLTAADLATRQQGEALSGPVIDVAIYLLLLAADQIGKEKGIEFTGLLHKEEAVAGTAVFVGKTHAVQLLHETIAVHKDVSSQHSVVMERRK